MPKLSENVVPSYRLRCQSGHAGVTLNREHIVLGPHGTGASRREYTRVIAEWMANGRQLPLAQADLTIVELISRFKRFATVHYRRGDGKPSSELNNLRDALRHGATTKLRKEFGLEAAQVILGHKTLKVTQVYAEKNVDSAIKNMSEVG